MQEEVFGRAPGGREIRIFTLGNAGGARVRVCEWGATVVSIEVPDRSGRLAHVALGFDALAGYLAPHPHFGGTIGRYANRIANARFTLGDQSYALPANDGPHHLHGGPVGFDRQPWTAAPLASGDAVELALESPDGDQGYPGHVRARAVFRLDDACALAIDYTAESDAPTPLSLAHHGYFNLAGGGPVLGHELELAADAYLPTDAGQIPTGELAPVAGGPFDFRAAKPLARDLERAGGYDHCFVLARERRAAPAFAARVRDPASGRTLEVHTTEPGLQLYSANRLDGTLAIRGGARPGRHEALCLETQAFPDGPNLARRVPSLCSGILEPGDTYRHSVVYRFGVDA